MIFLIVMQYMVGVENSENVGKQNRPKEESPIIPLVSSSLILWCILMPTVLSVDQERLEHL